MKNLFTFALILASLIGNAQVYRLRSEALAVSTTDKYNNWSPWTDWEQASVLIVIDVNSDEIDIYSKEEQHFSIISTEKTSDGIEMQCVDKDGVRCRIDMEILTNDQKKYTHLYIRYSNVSIVYQIKRS
jgi:hypothetical protein